MGLHSVPEAQALDAHVEKFSWIRTQPFFAPLQSEDPQEFAECPFLQDDNLFDGSSAIDAYSAMSIAGPNVMGSAFGCVLDDLVEADDSDHEHELPLLAALHSHCESVVSLRLAEHV